MKPAGCSTLLARLFHPQPIARILRKTLTQAVAACALVAGVHANQVQLAWDDNSADEAGFKIERSTAGGVWSQVATVSANTTTFADTGLLSGTQYSYRVRAYNSAGHSAYSNAVSYTTPLTNSAPTISSISAQAISVDGTTGPLAFTISDAQTAANSLTLSRSSSDTLLIPASGITFGGTGNNRTVTITPAPGRSGSATITITVSDGSLTTKTSFGVTVSTGAPSNTAPDISVIDDQTLTAGVPSAAINFSISDTETAAGNLSLSGSSSNTSLIPSSGITFGGSGSSRTVTLTPAAGQTGTTTLTIAVGDGQLSGTTSFTVTVTSGTKSTPTNTAPTISTIEDQVIAINGTTGPVPFTIGDLETAANSLTLSGTANAPSLIPNKGAITFGGTGANRTVTVTPSSNKSGTATVTLTLSDGALTTTTSFLVTVTSSANTGGSGGSTPPPTSSGAPTISSQPQHQNASVGNSVTFSVSATGSPAPTYQWRKDGNAIPGATSSTLSLTDIQPTDAAAYSVVVTNSGGSVTSETAMLNVILPTVAGTYAGTFEAGGSWILQVNKNRTAVYTAQLPNLGLAMVLQLKLSNTGSFTVVSNEVTALDGGAQPASVAGGSSFRSFSSPKTTSIDLTGTLNDGVVQGSISGVGLNFSGALDPADGPAAAVAGFYLGYGSDGESTLYVSVRTNGQTIAIVSTPTGVEWATGTTDTNGSFGGYTNLGKHLIATVKAGRGTAAGTLTSPSFATVHFLEQQALGGESGSRLVNASIRTNAGTGSNTLIAGFFIKGSTEKSMLIRAIGPSLVPLGINNALSDPQLALYAGASVAASNDNWNANETASDIVNTSRRTGAFPLDATSRDAVLLTKLGQGAYSAHVGANNGASGVALMELYDADTTGDARLVNISARSNVTSGEGVLIIGFAIAGDSPRQVLIRGLGPTLAELGVPGILANPRLQLYNSAGSVIEENDDWGGSWFTSVASSNVGAYPISNPNSKDAVLLVTLNPGVYTAILSGAGGNTGVGLLELYEIP